MGLSFMTALTIQAGGVEPGAYAQDGKFGGLISHDATHGRHPGMALVSTAPQYDTAAEAIDAMRETIAEVCKMDLIGEFNKGKVVGTDGKNPKADEATESEADSVRREGGRESKAAPEDVGRPDSAGD